MSHDTDERTLVLRAHPTDPALLLLDTRPGLANTMGAFGPARFVGMRGGAYAMPAAALPAWEKFARAQQLTIIDNRPQPAARKVYDQPLPECAHCHIPAKRGHTFRFCPGCGQPWEPIQIRPDHRGGNTTDAVSCPSCGHRQAGGFTFCSRCGAPAPDQLDGVQQALRAPRGPSKPTSLGDAIAEIRRAAGVDRRDHQPITDRRNYLPQGLERHSHDEHRDQLRATMPDRVSPECAAGKCAGCDGSTWDPDADAEQPDTCGCPCHPWTAQPDPDKEHTHA